MSRLLGDQATLDAIKDGRAPEAIRRLWDAGLAAFRARRERYLIYR